MTFDGKAVGESYAPSGRMSRIGPVACFQQNRVKQTQLHDFAGDAVDLHPVAESNSVFAHQHEPAQEADDEVLERDGKAGAGESQKGTELARRPEDYK